MEFSGSENFYTARDGQTRYRKATTHAVPKLYVVIIRRESEKHRRLNFVLKNPSLCR